MNETINERFSKSLESQNPSNKQIGMLTHICRRYIDKLPDVMDMNGKRNLKFHNFAEYVKKQDKHEVNNLISIILSDLIPDEQKEKKFDSFIKDYERL